MSDEPASYDFVYVETDIPPGMTIREWRAQRSAERAARREQVRAERRRRALAPLTALGRASARARTTGSAMLRTFATRCAEAVPGLAIRGRGYAHSAAPQANLSIRTCVRHP